eukprot:12401749-Karenia_brevis.AAC.1
MAALKLVTPSDRLLLRVSFNNDAKRCHCLPFSQAGMAAQKQSISSNNEADHVGRRAPADHL